MKARILSFVIALLVLFAVGNAYAQKPHFNKKNPPSVIVTEICVNPESSYYQICVSGTVYGLGNASSARAYLDYTYDANFNCYNPGKSAGPVPGQSGPVSGQTEEINLTVRNGQADFYQCFTIAGSCTGNALSSVVTALAFTKLELVVNGTQIATPSLRSYWNGSIVECE